MAVRIKTSVMKYKNSEDEYVDINGLDSSFIDDSKTQDENHSWSTKKLTTEFGKKADLTLVGAANGIASLDSAGKIPSGQLPSYVDDVLEGYVNPAESPNYTHFYKNRTAQAGGTYGYSDPYTPETGKVYIDLSTGKCYRWGGTVYAEVSNNDNAVIAIERNSLTFTATRADGTTFTFNQQDSDTKNTAGSINNPNTKMFLVGAESQAINILTRTNDKAYIGADNKLYSNGDVVLTDGQIDDNAGTGDYHKFWSANKLNTELSSILERLADLEYIPISLQSLSVSPSLVEDGSTQTTASLSYQMNRKATQMKLDNEVIAYTDASGTIPLTNLNLASNKTWTLKATDERKSKTDEWSSKTVTMSFTNKVKYGVAALPANINDAFLNGLANRVLSTGKVKSISVNAGSGEYVWYALPVSYGTCKFTVGGFTGGFTQVAQFNHQNESGKVVEYRVYRSDNANLGSQNIAVS